ncbi:DUF262 domain-containing protein [Dysgonomonas reticulitermitis]
MAELNVSRKSIYQLLTDTLNESKGKIFVIPEYQRPYKWDIEKCDVLWNDIKTFHLETKGKQSEDYFLGTIVSCDSDEGVAIIDGQQRLTSLFLLLRAFYTKLEIMQKEMPDDDEIKGLMNQIAPCIWDVNEMSQKVKDKSLIHIKSMVAIDSDNEIFHTILKTGEKQLTSKSIYAQNYAYFYDQCNEYAQNYALDWKELCLCILKQCIVLPIECKDLDSALTIFSTLNDRGMPLSDSDIFKAQLYKFQKTDEEKNKFTEDWKKLSEIVEDAKISLDDLFRYYTHVIRAKNKDKSKEVGLRKFYHGDDKQYSRLKNANIMKDLTDLAEFWKLLNLYKDDYCTLESKQYIHCLTCYPNEYWKYPTTVFYCYCRDNGKDTKELMPAYLRRLLAFLFVRFVENPTVNAIKDTIFASCIETLNSGSTGLELMIKSDFDQRISTFSSSKISKPMILLHAYLFDKEQELIPNNFQIEHIFPRKWDSNHFTWTKEDADIYLNMFGNKITFESKLNIEARNGYFDKKKTQYAKSNIKEILSLSRMPNEDWNKDDIKKRNDSFILRLKTFFNESLNEDKSIMETLLEYTSEGGNIVLIKETIGNICTFIYESSLFPNEVVLGEENMKTINKETIRFATIEDAIDKIDLGIVKYGKKIILDENIRPLIYKRMNA